MRCPDRVLPRKAVVPWGRLERESRSLEIDATASIKKGERKTRDWQPKGRTDAEPDEVGKAKADLQSTISGVPTLSTAGEAQASPAFFMPGARVGPGDFPHRTSAAIRITIPVRPHLDEDDFTPGRRRSGDPGHEQQST